MNPYNNGDANILIIMNWVRRRDVICMVDRLQEGLQYRRRKPCTVFFSSLNQKAHLSTMVSSFNRNVERKPTKANYDKGSDVMVSCVAYHASRSMDYLR